MSTLKVDTIQGKTTAGTVAMPSGSIVQVQSTTSDAQTTVSGVSFSDFMSVAITPKFSSSKIHVSCSINLSGQNTTGGSTDEGIRYSGVKLFRDTTQIAVNSNTSGNRTAVWFSANTIGQTTNEAYRMANSSGQFLDSPSTTSATTYKIQIGQSSQTSSFVVTNTSPIDDNNTYTHHGVSTLTVMEIKQ